MYATKEAILIKEHEPGSEVYIFYLDLKVFGKGFQEFVNRAKENWGVKYINGRPSEIEENPKTRDLILRYEDPVSLTAKEMVTDLVVLCPAFISELDNKKIAEILGAETDEYGFFKAKELPHASVDTNVLGVFICGCCQGPKDIPESVTQASGAAERAAEIIALAASKGGKK
jgi:heterodisulfide reductase subunit A